MKRQCGWLQSWWHTRLRSADMGVWTHLLENGETIANAQMAWDLFLAQPGQEHWYCACAGELKAIRRAEFSEWIER